MALSLEHAINNLDYSMLDGGENMQDDGFVELKQVYENLWEDARMLVKDLSNSIRVIGLFGILLLFTSILQLSITDSNYLKIISGTARTLDYIYFYGGAIGIVMYILGGIFMLRWYLLLKKRYSRVIELEKTINKQ